MTIARRDDWVSRLHEFLDERKHADFEYGSHDCALFACDAVEAMCGQDPGEWFRGKYENNIGASRCIQEFTNGGDLRDTLERVGEEAQWDRVEEAFAQRGDVAALENEGSIIIGIVLSNGVACANREHGWVLCPRDAILDAWRVPYSE